MPQLLLELFSEEIPARMQARAETDLLKAVTQKLADAGLAHGEAFAWSGPRRLGVCIEDLAARSEDVREERKGPKVGAPDKAIEGFMRGAGLASIDEAEVRADPRKGEFYVAVVETPGRPATEIIADAVPDLIRSFHWPKSMRWGPNETSEGTLRWVRPLQRIVCVLDGRIVPFSVGGIASSNETEGHRIHGRGPYTVTGWEDYRAQLESDGKVRLQRADRKALIARDAARLCRKAGFDLMPDEGLLEEVTGLAEWPVVILGDMDPAFLELPPEVIRLSMRTHQKYFAVRDPGTGALAPHFVVVANIKARDQGKTIAAGNAKVLSARLEDARFFWENDKNTGLEAMADKLGSITFKEELGSIGDKVERVAALARELAPKVGADPDLAERAARLSKSDLVSEMVYEFPELQGVMGRYYALDAGEDPQVADAIADHYKPQGPSDAVPTAPVSIAVALADKLDTLVGFWAINEKPTGSKDPFALRRAALGVVRIVLENGVRLSLVNGLELALEETVVSQAMNGRFMQHAGYDFFVALPGISRDGFQIDDAPATKLEVLDLWRSGRLRKSELFPEGNEPVGHMAGEISDLLAFFADRLKQVLRDEGMRHDLIDAVFSMESPLPPGGKGDRPSAGQAAPAEAPAQRAAVSANNDDLVLIVKRVEALTDFLATDDGANLLAGYKRAANILRAEEKKDGTVFGGAPDPALFDDDTEQALHAALQAAQADLAPALAAEDFEAAMTALATLRAPADAFFDSVMVNDDRPAVRQNRLKLLANIRGALHTVADFSKIEA
ncbi:MAG: glycine--tRNA ligase subunit beta [Pseudomonadota bacterium]